MAFADHLPLNQSLGGRPGLGARTPVRPRERIAALFRSPQNIAYLRKLFASQVPPGPLRRYALDTLEDSVYEFELGGDLVYSDPLAQRGDSRPAANLWGEVRRLNLAFYEYRTQFIRDKAALLSGRADLPPGLDADDEPYHFRMFTADSLHPPGLEHLNGTGPLYGIREDQTAVAEPRRPLGAGPAGDPGVDPDDWGWDSGKHNRTPEEAIAEYWGEDRVESSTAMIGNATSMVGGEAYIDRYGRGPAWRENLGTRFMRYPTIPVWQNLSRGRNYDRDIGETLGTLSREMDNHVRRWDTERIRNKRGDEYRRYGPRSGSTL